MSFGQEIAWGFTLLVLGLFLEAVIDEWRGRKEGRQMQTTGTFPELTKKTPKGKGKKR